MRVAILFKHLLTSSRVICITLPPAFALTLAAMAVADSTGSSVGCSKLWPAATVALSSVLAETRCPLLPTPMSSCVVKFSPQSLQKR